MAVLMGVLRLGPTPAHAGDADGEDPTGPPAAGPAVP